MKVNPQTNKPKEDSDKTPISGRPIANLTKQVASSGQHPPVTSSVKARPKKSKSLLKSPDLPTAKRISAKNCAEQGTKTALKPESSEQQKVNDQKHQVVRSAQQQFAICSLKGRLKTTKSAPKSSDLPNAKKKSGKSSEGQPLTQNITKTMTTNAIVDGKFMRSPFNKSPDKEEGEKAIAEQSTKRRIMRSIGQSAFLQKRCGKGAPRLLATGTIILGKYRIEQMIGGGGFGQIYRAFDETKKRTAAVKAIPSDHEPARMVLEQMVLLKLRGFKHIPALYASGCTDKTHFIVMELLGKNLSELRRRESLQRFSLQTVVMCGVQAVDAIKIVHDADFVHRDIKPSNFCIGIRGPTKRTIYLLDFGMVRRFRRQDGEERKKREFAGFRGTLRYASFNVHLGKEQSPTDDFISLYYSFVELGEGSLPWKATKNSNEVKLLKLNTSFVDFYKHLPKSFDEFLKYLLKILENSQHVDYENLKQMLRKHLPSNFNEAKALFDWEVIDHSVDAVTTHDSQRL